MEAVQFVSCDGRDRRASHVPLNAVEVDEVLGVGFDFSKKPREVLTIRQAVPARARLCKYQSADIRANEGRASVVCLIVWVAARLLV